jgi:recombinational DNA repair protein (RecF pathway)
MEEINLNTVQCCDCREDVFEDHTFTYQEEKYCSECISKFLG